jgi:hypothetical protein
MTFLAGAVILLMRSACDLSGRGRSSKQLVSWVGHAFGDLLMRQCRSWLT